MLLEYIRWGQVIMFLAMCPFCPPEYFLPKRSTLSFIDLPFAYHYTEYKDVQHPKNESKLVIDINCGMRCGSCQQ